MSISLIRVLLPFALAFVGPLAAARGEQAMFRGPDGRPILLRGIGWSPWHPETGWARSQETKQTDLRLLKEAHINCLRTWGPIEPKHAAYWQDHGFLLVTQVSGGWHKDLTHTRFRDGKPSTQPNYADPKAIAAFQQVCRDYARRTGDSPSVILSLLGNEFSWVGKDAKGNYAYAGHDDITLDGFRKHLEERFDSVQRLNELCGTNFARFAEAQPLSSNHLKYEWWLFLRGAFESFMRTGYSALKEAAPHRPISYAKLMGRWDPCCEDAGLSFLDVGGQNLYWHWDKDWARYGTLLKELIRHAHGKPVVITESGFQTWNDPAKEEQAARRMKQMLWNCFMHPEVVGVFPFLFNDEWWPDGDPKTQSPGETWGIVTAHRQPKKTYAALAEVYSQVEKLEDFLVEAKSPPLVALSCQDLDWVLAKDDGTKRFVEVARALYAKAVSFRMVNSEDILSLDPATTPFLLLCDNVLLRGPDGKLDSARKLLDYVAGGGQVLYFSPTPFKVAYGEAAMPISLDPKNTNASWGRGRFRFVLDREVLPELAGRQIAAFLGEALSSQTIAAVTTDPATDEFNVFFSVIEAAHRKVLVVVNEAEHRIRSVTVKLSTTASKHNARLSAADGAAIAVDGNENGKTITLANFETYAIISLE